MAAYSPPIRPRFRPNIAGYSAESLRYWKGTAARWGIFAGVTGLFLVSQVPLVKVNFLQKLPAIGWYWKVDEEKK
ncbi:hypothetical protein LPJ61_001643 [Coemansia biformis]|uniref:Uncharacterized protein n=1 Tax=Coemansia biformis TaxID=1286918 RepID=A0A9W7YEI6_9FUNG|nr:hypothetical protein LPJ61_001643 [Coemansia biformis]